MFNDTAQLKTVYPENPFYNFFIFLLLQFKITNLAAYLKTPIFTDALIEARAGKKGLEEIQKILAENCLSKKFKNFNQTPYIRQAIGVDIPSLKSLSLYSLFGKKISAKQLSTKLMMEFEQENHEYKIFMMNELKPSIRCFASLLIQIKQFTSGKQIKDIDEVGTILHCVAKYGNSFILKSFLKHTEIATLINRQNARGLTPLHYACQYNGLSVINILLQSTADQTKQDNNKQTSFHLACLWNTSIVVKFLLNNQADMEIRDKKGERAINFASRNKDRNVLSVLLAMGAKKYLNSPTNLNPLISAVTQDGDHYPATIWKLAEAGAILNAIDKKSYEEESAEVLFFFAIKAIKNDNNKDATQYCQESKNLSVNRFNSLVNKTNQLWEQNLNYFQLSVPQFEDFQKITSCHEQTTCLTR